jgi:hypothetical protein
VIWKNIFPRVIDEWYLWMKMWMKNDIGWSFSWTFATSFVLQKKKKRNKIQEIYVGLLWTIRQIKCSSYIWTNILTLQHPNHIKFETTSNSMAHKPIDPLKGMCQFKHYMSTTKSYVTIRNWNNIKYLRTPHHFKLFLIFIRSLNPLATWIMKLHSFFLYY